MLVDRSSSQNPRCRRLRCGVLALRGRRRDRSAAAVEPHHAPSPAKDSLRVRIEDSGTDRSSEQPTKVGRQGGLDIGGLLIEDAPPFVDSENARFRTGASLRDGIAVIDGGGYGDVEESPP
jgi:hypothetical protein